MFKLFLALALLSSTAFAEDSRVLILEKHAVSGYVPPDFSFKKDCQIFSNGNVEVMIVMSDQASGYTAQLPYSKVAQINRYTRFAKYYSIVSGPVICDAGTLIVTAHRKGNPVLITERMDCASNKWRKGYPANRLRAIATAVCGF
jgi:hypothetical protein